MHQSIPAVFIVHPLGISRAFSLIVSPEGGGGGGISGALAAS